MNPIKALIFLFSAVALAGIIFLINFTSVSFPQYLHIFLLFFLVSIFYLATYSAIDADSPSLVIVMRISRAGRGGLSYEKIKEYLGNDLLVHPRLKDLVDAKFVDLVGSSYKINKRGRLFILPVLVYRNFLRLGKGG